MTKKQVQSKLEKLFAKVSDDDYTEIEEYVENFENQDDSQDDSEDTLDVAEIAFRIAVQKNHPTYVEDHLYDVDLNDLGDCSSYLDEAATEEIENILMNAGAFRSWEYYSDEYPLSIETTNGSVLNFDPVFQKIVYDKFLKISGITENELIDFLENTPENEPELREPLNDFCLSSICESLHITVENGNIVLQEFEGNDEPNELEEIVEALGWEFLFEGESSKFEMNGVFFVPNMESDKEK